MGKLLSKRLRFSTYNGMDSLNFWCPGCNHVHTISINGPNTWAWNGDAEKPVFSPSVLVSGVKMTEEAEEMIRNKVPPPGGKYPSVPDICHSFVGCNGAQPGQIVFLGDCTHHLKGQVVDLPDFPKNVFSEDTAE